MEAERRPVTILFANMAGFAAFTERSGEEAAYALMGIVHRLTSRAVQAHGGTVKEAAPARAHPAGARGIFAAIGSAQLLEGSMGSSRTSTDRAVSIGRSGDALQNRSCGERVNP
jgi:class 3 adenylate cyclase